VGFLTDPNNLFLSRKSCFFRFVFEDVTPDNEAASACTGYGARITASCHNDWMALFVNVS
jgi:hypothetical protein